MCRHVCNEKLNLLLKWDQGLNIRSHLIELHNVGGVLLLVDLLLSLEQCVLAMCTAADSVIISLIQDGAYTAHAADAAPTGAMDTVGWLTGAGVGTQGILAGTGELVCKAQHRTGSSESIAFNHPTAHDGEYMGADELRVGSAFGQEAPTPIPSWGQVLRREGLLLSARKEPARWPWTVYLWGSRHDPNLALPPTALLHLPCFRHNLYSPWTIWQPSPLPNTWLLPLPKFSLNSTSSRKPSLIP